jgi:methionyl-tRNA formyltransferase
LNNTNKYAQRIVFFGTPDFAVATLSALLTNYFNVVGVVTAPDKPAGRNLQLQQSAVKQFALAHGLHLLQPTNLKDDNFINELRDLQADVQVIVAFRMLPEIVWNMPKLGTYNVHASLLPQYRGAAPINWAIINGDIETGVTTFKLVHKIDEGNIIFQEKINIDPLDNAGTVHDKLMNLGAECMVKTIAQIFDGTAQEFPQKDDETLKHAPKLFTENCTIDWQKDAVSICNLIRGLSPFPGAITSLAGKKFKIYFAKANIEAHSNELGSFTTDNKTYLKIFCNGGSINCTDVQIEGKKRMAVADFLRGWKA